MMIETPLPLKRLSLILLDRDAPAAAATLAGMEVIHLINGEEDEILCEAPARTFQLAHSRLEGRFRKISRYLGQAEMEMERVPIERITIDRVEQTDRQIKQLWRKISDHEEQIRLVNEKIHYHQQLLNSLGPFENLDIDLSRLSSPSLFLTYFVGTIPASELQPLEQALSLANALIRPFRKNHEQHYILVVTENRHHQDIREILKSANFHELTIPHELRRQPDQVKKEIEKRLGRAQRNRQFHEDSIWSLVQSHLETIRLTRSLLEQSAPFAATADSLNGRGQLVQLQGWIPARRQEELEQQFNDRLQSPCLLTFRDPTKEEMRKLPSLQYHSPLFSSFQQLVNQFGVPRYGELDPTRLFAFSYTLMFGMMFGDIGHGAAIIGIGYLFRRQITGLFPFATIAGLSSMLFGVLYGSVFGVEHLFTPLWVAPMEDPIYMLLVALSWGIGFLILVQLISIFNLLAADQPQEALLDSRGVAGLLFYLGGVYGGYQYIANHHFSIIELAALLLPLSLILYQQWLKMEGPFSEKILITIIEAIDRTVNNLSATLSFLRVAAFSLNHVALAMAVFTLAAMMDQFGHVVTLLLGNLFIIVLEGGIVAIQCLRLEYHEGFSRYYNGDGIRFTPLKSESY